jgi:GTP pyrophosphokinase
LVKTQRARSKIRTWFKKQNRDQNEIQGKLMLAREVTRLGMQEPDDKALQELASKLNRSVDELYLSLGCGDLSIARTINFLLEAKGSDDSLVVVPPTSETSSSDAVTVLGLKDLLTNFAKCCNPTPGDEIIGYITRGRGATVHRMDCPNVLRIRDRERLIKVSWGEKIRTYPVSIRVTAYDRQGLMGDLSYLLESESVNILDVVVRVSKNIADLNLIIEVKDIAQLSRLLSRMENIPNVLEAQRIKGG